jgi:hypothetical protein
MDPADGSWMCLVTVCRVVGVVDGGVVLADGGFVLGTAATVVPQVA